MNHLGNILGISLQHVGFHGRDDLEAEPPVDVHEGPHETESEVLLHHDAVVAVGALLVAELVVVEVEPPPVPRPEGVLPALEKEAFQRAPGFLSTALFEHFNLILRKKSVSSSCSEREIGALTRGCGRSCPNVHFIIRT